MAVDVQPLLDAIEARLKADGNLRTRVGDRIYHASVPLDSLTPLIVFELAEASVTRYFDNSHAHPFLVDVDVVLATAEAGTRPLRTLSEIEDRLSVVLDRHTYTPTPAGYERMRSFVRQRGLRVRDVDTLRSTTRLTLWATTT